MARDYPSVLELVGGTPETQKVSLATTTGLPTGGTFTLKFDPGGGRVVGDEPLGAGDVLDMDEVHRLSAIPIDHRRLAAGDAAQEGEHD